MIHVTIFCISSHPYHSFIPSFTKNVLNSYYIPNIIPTIRDTNGEHIGKSPCFYGAFQLEGTDVKQNNHSSKCTIALNQKEI